VLIRHQEVIRWIQIQALMVLSLIQKLLHWLCLFTLSNIGSQAVLGNDGGVAEVVVDIRLLGIELL